MKQLKDYLHLYFGCECESAFIGKKMRLVGITKTSTNEYGEYVDSAMVEFWINGKHECRPCSLRSIKPILRPLSDMTEEEWKAIMLEFSIDIVDAYNSYIRYGDKPKHILILENRLTTNTLKFNDGMILLRKYFDLFGLIESGLAIDKTTLNQKP